MASGGYPKKYESGLVISGLDEMGQTENCFVYHAGTKINDNGEMVNAGGRVLGVTATAESLPKALEIAYNGVKSINWKDVHYRNDIGQRALKAIKS